MRFIASSTCCVLFIACHSMALAQKAELRREIGRGCSAVAAGQATLVSFPTRTRVKLEVPVEGILMKPAGEGPFPAVVVMHGPPRPTKAPRLEQARTWSSRRCGASRFGRAR